jgi:hypothetical protein
VDRKELIKQDFEWNVRLIKQLVEGITNEESVLQLPFPTNCMNWILGHILVGRNTVVEILNEESLWDEDVLVLYRSGSDPIREDSEARHWDVLLMDLDESQSRINKALELISESQMDEAVETSRGLKPIWQHLSGLHWHETYHIGQIEIMSQYAQSSR